MPIDKSYKNVSPQDYHALFSSPLGEAVLEDLMARFYYIESYCKGDSHETAHREGHRFVLGFINNKIVQGESEPEIQSEES